MRMAALSVIKLPSGNKRVGVWLSGFIRSSAGMSEPASQSAARTRVKGRAQNVSAAFAAAEPRGAEECVHGPAVSGSQGFGR